MSVTPPITSDAPPPGGDALGSITQMAAIVAGVRRLAMQRELSHVAVVAAETAAELVQGLRARCYFVHTEGAQLWTDDGAEFPTHAGLAGIAARTGQAATAATAHGHPAYRREVDDPEGNGSERLLAQPIVTHHGDVHAVVVVARSAMLPDFGACDLSNLGCWAQHVAPVFHMLHLEGESDELDDAHEIAGKASVYRGQALARLAAGEDDLGVLFGRLHWVLRQSHWLAVLAALVAVAFLTQVEIDEYAAGPAFLVAAGYHDVPAPRDGVIAEVLVQPGDVVEQGQPLAKLRADADQTELAAAAAEYDRALLARLADPSDEALATAVARAQAARDEAAARVEASVLLAPHAGHVGDVRVEVGRALQSGQVALTIGSEGARDRQPLVRALVPGRYRPALAVGQAFDLDFDGFSNAVQHITVSAVSEEVIDEAEARRTLGRQLGDALAVTEPAIVVEAHLHDATIEVDGRSWSLHEGMVGRANIVVRREAMIFLIFPQLRRLLNRV